MVCTTYTPSISQQSLPSNQNLSKVPTDNKYVERSVFIKEVNLRTLWTFKLGTQDGVNIRIWTIVGFQQKEKDKIQKN